MENCRYEGEDICSFELKDEWGIYHHERVVELKRAASKGYLRCTDCGERVYLAAGLIREPYFAHYDAANCSYGNHMESEELRIGKRLLYYMLKKSFPNGEIKVRSRMEEGFYSSFYIVNEDSKLAIDYRLTQLPIKLFDKRKEYYMEHEILPIFILGARQDKKLEQLNWYQECVQELLGYCSFFDAVQATMTLKRSFRYNCESFGIHQVFQESYPVHDLCLLENGTFTCDFLEQCRRKEELLMQQVNEQEENERKEQQRRELYIQEQMQQEQGKELKKQAEFYQKIIERVDFDKIEIKNGIRRDILQHCIDLIQSNQIDLVSQKYLDYIKEFQFHINS